jgi:RHS repeat-associated protein
MSNLSTITDARSNTTTFVYGAFNRLEKVIYPGMAQGPFDEFTYDSVGRLATRKDRLGITTTFVYDGLGRLTDKTFSNAAPALFFRYDEGAGQKGRLTSAWRGTPPTSMITWTYDLAGQVRTETSTRAGGTAVVGYDYDLAGNRIELLLDQQSKVRYTYDDRGLPEYVKRVLPTPPATADFHFVFDPAGRRKRLEFPNGMDTDYWYDQRSRLTRIKIQGSGVIADLTYPDYDSANNREERAGSGAPPERYAYDHFYRLDTVDRDPAPPPAPLAEDYGYDGVGNRLSSISLPTWAYNERNQLQSNGESTFTYYPNGNLWTKTETGANWLYEWDEEDRLERVTLNGAQVAAYAYDPLGRRIERLLPGPILHTYVYDGEDILKQDFTSLLLEPGMLDPPPHLYVHGPGIDEPLAVVHGNDSVWNYHADGLGSIIAVTDSATQQIAYARAYDAFGNLESGIAEEGYAYTGREWEPESGLYYYRARYYDPKIGRFISEDPIGFGGGINFYSYVENNPVNYVDPDGLRLRPPVRPPIRPRPPRLAPPPSGRIPFPPPGQRRPPSDPRPKIGPPGDPTDGPAGPPPTCLVGGGGGGGNGPCWDAYENCLRQPTFPGYDAVDQLALCSGSLERCLQGHPTIFPPGVIVNPNGS